MSNNRRLPRFAAPILAATLLAPACSSGDSHPELDSYLCDQSDLGEDYQQLIEGDFSPRDLADLGPDADTRARDFHEAGMQRGRFVLFKQALPKPPFEPPVNVVCQVIEFDSPGSARSWIAGLTPDATVIQTSGIAWIPDGSREVEELTRLTASQSPATSIRAFRVLADDGTTRMAAAYQFQDSGRYVLLWAVGGELPPDSNEPLFILDHIETARATNPR